MFFQLLTRSIANAQLSQSARQSLKVTESTPDQLTVLPILTAFIIDSNTQH